MKAMKAIQTAVFLVGVLVLTLNMAYAGITVTGPGSGAVFCIGKPNSITWTKAGVSDPLVYLRLWNSSMTTLVYEFPGTYPNSGNYSWVIPVSVPPGSYRIRVRATNGTSTDGVYGDSAIFSIQNCIDVTSPAAGASWARGTNKTISWSTSGSPEPLVFLRLWNSAMTTLVYEFPGTYPNSGNYNWPIPDTISVGTYRIRVRVTDGVSTDGAFGDSAAFNITSGESDGHIDWDRIRDKIREMLEAEIVPWWRIKGPWPGPGPCLSCGMEFGLDKIRERLDALKLRTQLGVELFNQDGKLADLGKFGKGLSLKGSAKLSKINSRQNDLLVSGKGFKLVFRNSLGEIVHTQAINIEEKAQGMMR